MKKTISIIGLLFTCTVSNAQSNDFLPKKSNDGWNTSAELTKSHKMIVLDSLIDSGRFKQVTSVAITHKGVLAFDRYYNESEIKTLHNTRSATKTITGTTNRFSNQRWAYFI